MKLGQIFLINSRIAKRIIALANIKPNDIVIEIGPGKGILTSHLLIRANKVIAVEIDSKLCELLREKFAGEDNFILMNEDILKVSIKNLRGELNFQNENIKIIGNIPFSITSPLMDWLIREKGEFESALLMVQREFADRILANPGSKKYGKLSVIMELFFKRKGYFEINKSAFYPKPAVNAFIIKVSAREKYPIPLEEDNYEEFKKFVNNCFAYKRKTLMKSLQYAMGQKKGEVIKDEISNILKGEAMPLNVRAEQISIEGFWRIYQRLKGIKKEK